MTQTNSKIRSVTTWLSKLAMMTAEGTTPVSKERIGVLAMALAADLPESAFSEKTLEDVAAGNEFFPSYAVLKTVLSEWGKIEAAKLQIAGPESEAILINRAENTLNATGDREWRERDRLFGYVKQFANYPQALLIGKMLARKVKRYAPENLDCLPEEFLEGLK